MAAATAAFRACWPPFSSPCCWFLIIVSLLALLSTPVAYWLGRATEIGALIKQKLQSMRQPLALLDELQKALNAIGSGESTLRVEAQQSQPWSARSSRS